jgi:hypothetical protein
MSFGIVIESTKYIGDMDLKVEKFTWKVGLQFQIEPVVRNQLRVNCKNSMLHEVLIGMVLFQKSILHFITRESLQNNRQF